MKYGLDGKTVILTGASGGFGSEIARILTEKHGCNVIGIGRSEEKMRELKKSLGDKGDLFTYVLFDITDGEKWRSFAENLTGTPDIMINCAGILPPFAAIEKQTMGNTEHTMRVNFLSHATAIDTMLPYIMKATDCQFLGALPRCGRRRLQREQGCFQELFGSAQGGNDRKSQGLYRLPGVQHDGNIPFANGKNAGKIRYEIFFDAARKDRKKNRTRYGARKKKNDLRL